MLLEKLNELQLSWTTWISIILVLIMVVLNLKDRKTKQIVGYVSKLYTYPVKSTMRVDLQEMEITNLGPKHDRQFALLNEYGNYMSSSRFPKLVLIQPSFKDAHVLLEAEGMPQLRLPLEMTEEEGDHINSDIKILGSSTAGVHVSKEADGWFAKFLDVPGCQLYSFPKGGKPRYTVASIVEIPNYTNEKDSFMFANDTPLMILSESSVEDFKTNFDCDNLTVERFRPNIVVKGSTPFQEDDWPNLEIGNVTLRNLFPCARCPAINVDPVTANVNSEVRTALKKHHTAPEKFTLLKGKEVCGGKFGVRRTGTIKVGDPIYLVAE